MTDTERCVLCDEIITAETDSGEHIIPNAIGGRTEVRGFLCRACNSVAGDTWDAELADQLHSLSAFFDIVRDRGEVPLLRITTTAGESLVQQPGGRFVHDKPSHSLTPVESGLQLNLSARTREEARKMLKGLKRKYPKLDVEALMQTAQDKTRYPQGLVEMSANIGGSDAGRSIVKTALAFIHSCEISTQVCELALDYLRNEEAIPCYGFFHQADPVLNRDKAVPLHCIAVVGNAARKLLLGYVEYFGLHRMVVICSQRYAGPDLCHAYGLNPMTGAKVDVNFQLDFSPEDIQPLYDGALTSNEALAQILQFLIPVGQQASVHRELDRIVPAAREYASKQLGITTETIPASLMPQFTQIMMERLQPFIQHLTTPKPPPGDLDAAAPIDSEPQLRNRHG